MTCPGSSGQCLIGQVRRPVRAWISLIGMAWKNLDLTKTSQCGRRPSCEGKSDVISQGKSLKILRIKEKAAELLEKLAGGVVQCNCSRASFGKRKSGEEFVTF